MKLLPEPDQKPVLLTPKENPFIEAMLSQSTTSKEVFQSIGNWNHDQLYQFSQNAALNHRASAQQFAQQAIRQQQAMQAQQSMSTPGGLTMLQAGSLGLLRTQT